MAYESIIEGNEIYNPCQAGKNINSQQALLSLGTYLKNINYQFTTITPESHRLVLARRNNNREMDYNVTDQVLENFFGWNVPVLKKTIPLPILSLISEANAAHHIDPLYLQSRVRFSTVNDNLFLHSAYPTSENNAVFFGPDTYRFIRFLKNKIKGAQVIIDLGCGPGTGGIVLSNLLNQKLENHVKKLYLGDINPTALDYAHINLALNKVSNAEVILSNMLDDIPQGADLIIANPPFIIDPDQRTYRHGGSHYGSQIAVDMLRSALNYLGPGGIFALYTGSCVIRGKDIFFEQIQPLLNQYTTQFEYEEIDCDIFGEELSKPSYQNVDRIAAVSLIVKKSL